MSECQICYNRTQIALRKTEEEVKYRQDRKGSSSVVRSRGIVLVQLGWTELCSVQSTVQSGRVWLRIILSTDQTYKTILSSYTSIIHTYNLLTSWRDPQCEFSWCPCVRWYQMMSRAWCVFEDKCSWCLHYPTTGVRTLNQHTELGLLSLTADNVGTNNDCRPVIELWVWLPAEIYMMTVVFWDEINL